MDNLTPRQISRNEEAVRAKAQEQAALGKSSGLAVTAEGEIIAHADKELPAGAKWWIPTDEGITALAKEVAGDYLAAKEQGAAVPKDRFDGYVWTVNDFAQQAGSPHGKRIFAFTSNWQGRSNAGGARQFFAALNAEIKYQKTLAKKAAA